MKGSSKQRSRFVSCAEQKTSSERRVSAPSIGAGARSPGQKLKDGPGTTPAATPYSDPIPRSKLRPNHFFFLHTSAVAHPAKGVVVGLGAGSMVGAGPCAGPSPYASYYYRSVDEPHAKRKNVGVDPRAGQSPLSSPVDNFRSGTVAPDHSLRREGSSSSILPKGLPGQRGHRENGGVKAEGGAGAYAPASVKQAVSITPNAGVRATPKRYVSNAGIISRVSAEGSARSKASASAAAASVHANARATEVLVDAKAVAEVAAKAKDPSPAAAPAPAPAPLMTAESSPPSAAKKSSPRSTLEVDKAGTDLSPTLKGSPRKCSPRQPSPRLLAPPSPSPAPDPQFHLSGSAGSALQHVPLQLDSATSSANSPSVTAVPAPPPSPAPSSSSLVPRPRPHSPHSILSTLHSIELPPEFRMTGSVDAKHRSDHVPDPKEQRGGHVPSKSIFSTTSEHRVVEGEAAQDGPRPQTLLSLLAEEVKSSSDRVPDKVSETVRQVSKPLIVNPVIIDVFPNVKEYTSEGDLIINCDVPQGVRITILSGNLTVEGNVGAHGILVVLNGNLTVNKCIFKKVIISVPKGEVFCSDIGEGSKITAQGIDCRDVNNSVVLRTTVFSIRARIMRVNVEVYSAEDLYAKIIGQNPSLRVVGNIFATFIESHQHPRNAFTIEQLWKQVGARRMSLEHDRKLHDLISAKRLALQKEEAERHKQFVQTQGMLSQFLARNKGRGRPALPPPPPPLPLPVSAASGDNAVVDSPEAMRAQALII